MSTHTYTCSKCDFSKTWKGSLVAKKKIAKAHSKKCGKAPVKKCVEAPKQKYAKRGERQTNVNIMEIVGRRFLVPYVEFVKRNDIVDGIARGWDAYHHCKHKHKSVGECLTTKDIIPKKLIDFCDHEAFQEPELLIIKPELPPLMCFQNTGFLEKQYPDKYKAINGFNATACMCGCMMSFELHCVVLDKEEGDYIDFTRDFCGEKKKWFIPFTNQNTDPRVLQGLLDIGIHTYNNGDNLDVACSCGFKYTGENRKQVKIIKTAQEFGDEIEQKTNMTIIGGVSPYR